MYCSTFWNEDGRIGSGWLDLETHIESSRWHKQIPIEQNVVKTILECSLESCVGIRISLLRFFLGSLILRLLGLIARLTNSIRYVSTLAAYVGRTVSFSFFRNLSWSSFSCCLRVKCTLQMHFFNSVSAICFFKTESRRDEIGFPFAIFTLSPMFRFLDGSEAPVLFDHSISGVHYCALPRLRVSFGSLFCWMLLIARRFVFQFCR